MGFKDDLIIKTGIIVTVTSGVLMTNATQQLWSSDTSADLDQHFNHRYYIMRGIFRTFDCSEMPQV